MQAQLQRYSKQHQDLIIKFGLQFYSCLDQVITENCTNEANISTKDGQCQRIGTNIASSNLDTSNYNVNDIRRLQVDQITETPQQQCLDILVKQHQIQTDQQLEKIQQQISGVLISQSRQDLDIAKELIDTKTVLQRVYANQIDYSTKMEQIYGNSAKRGQAAELQVEQQILQQYPQAIITNTSKLINSCDLLVILNNKKILVEVKNYSSTVPQKETDKFLNDILTSQCDAGVFISFNQRIANKPRIQFETQQQNKQLVFIASQENCDLLLIILELLVQYSQSDQSTVQHLEHQNKIAFEQIQDTIKSIKKQKTQTEKQLKELQILLNSLVLVEQSFKPKGITEQ